MFHCPKMKSANEYWGLYAPSYASRSKKELAPGWWMRSKKPMPPRWWNRRVILDSQINLNPILQTIPAMKDFDWKSLFSNEDSTPLRNNNTAAKAMKTIQGILPISPKMIPMLGVQVLPNRRFCVAGRMLAGIKAPRNEALQARLLMDFLKYYLPCIGIHAGEFQVNGQCFERQERRFLQAYHYSSWRYSKAYKRFPWLKFLRTK